MTNRNMTCKEVITMLSAFPQDTRVVTFLHNRVMPCFDVHRIVDTQGIEGVEIGSGWIEVNGLSYRDKQGIIVASRLIEQLLNENPDMALFCFVDGDYYPIVGVRPLPAVIGMDGVWVELICSDI